MRHFACAVAIVLSSGSAHAEELSGRFKCRYDADWFCAPMPDDICIDRVFRPRFRAKLEVNLDTRRMSLNGLDAGLQRDEAEDSYWVQWNIAALGTQKLSMRTGDDGVRASLRIDRADGGSNITDFECRQLTRSRAVN